MSLLTISAEFVCAAERVGSNRDNRRVAETLSIVRRELHTDTGEDQETVL